MHREFTTMTRDRISILHQNGTLELKEPALYTALNAQDTWDEYGSTVHAMHNNSKTAPQELKNDLTKLRLDIVQAHQGKSTPMPTHGEFVAVVEKYNAWVSTQSLHLDPTATTPASPPVPKAPVKAPTTDDASHVHTTPDTTTPPPASTTTPVADTTEPAWLEKYHANSVQPLHVAVFGDNDQPGLDKRVSDIESYLGRTEDGKFVETFDDERHAAFADTRVATVTNLPMRVGPAIFAFLLTMFALVLLTWLANTGAGFWAAFAWWQPVVAVVVAIVTLLLTNRNTAPAVVREERV